MPEYDTSRDRPSPLLLKGNKRLDEIGAFKWSIPALSTRLDGKTVTTCPAAGVCASMCYATQGTFRFSNVLSRHQDNLRFVLEDLAGWEDAMTTELRSARYTNKWVRVHDSGDFFSDDYTEAWLRVMRASPGTGFYAYTKEVRRFKRLVEPNPPANFLWCYSLGGKEDQLIDRARDRMADVFPDEASIAQAGWHSQLGNDLLAVLGPAPVGMSANNIPRFVKKMNGRRFSELQAEITAGKAARREAERDG
ncbi:GP88 family protein [Amycolatopsis sp. VC5-11]|uniref:GP88 family protein n=1 Tax=Amycolatopsis sp. VC5-11 TaxID=3120156 RepID=UPI00300AFE60